jgi:hypothetical protein
VNEEALAHWGLMRQNKRKLVHNTNLGTSMNIQIHDILEETQALHATHSTTGLHHLFMSQNLPMAHYQEPLHRFTSVKMNTKNDNDNVLEASDSAGSNS